MAWKRFFLKYSTVSYRGGQALRRTGSKSLKGSQKGRRKMRGTYMTELWEDEDDAYVEDAY